MKLCPHCRAELAEGDRCEDRVACRRRLNANTRKTLARMATGKFVGFNPELAYRQAEKGPS